MQIMTLKSVFTHNVTVAICLSLTWRPPSSLSLSLFLHSQRSVRGGWQFRSRWDRLKLRSLA